MNDFKKIAAVINWEKSNGLVPAIIQNAENGMILMLGYMNKEALRKTFKTGCVWFYSRSKNRLWMKGEVSKNILNYVSAAVDCDGDTLLIKAIPAGPTCHTGNVSCFGEQKLSVTSTGSSIAELFQIIQERKKDAPKNSYTSSLMKSGLTTIVAKVAEESVEVCQAATRETKKRLIEETVDVLYHLFVLDSFKGVLLEEIEEEIKRRRK